jgi:polysaccharide deacetylase family protein (PEP-CTERM system associated)
MPDNEHKNVPNAFTVDVEEYFHVEAFSGYINKHEWGKYPRRAEEQTIQLLSLLESFQAKGTFFVLGWMAERYPALVKKIHDAGHEIASHGYEHTMITRMTEEGFREDLRKSKKVLESITNSKIKGYRAPTFSIVKETRWVYQILLEDGFEYSSSVFPIYHDRYGWPGFGADPRVMGRNGESEIWEVPMSTSHLGPLTIPVGGGGYLRTYPWFLTKVLVNRLAKSGKPLVVYIHPWELDIHHPAIEAPFLRRIRHYYGISSTRKKLEYLLQSLKFDTMANFLSLRKKNRDDQLDR